MGYFAEHGRRLAAVSFFIALIAAATAVWGQGPGAAAQAPSPSTPIQITADHGTTWLENDDRVFMLEGNIRLVQGTTVITMGRGVLWFDMKRKDAVKAYYIQAYGEDGIQLNQDGAIKQGKSGMFAMTTTGEIKIQPIGSEMQNQSQAADPLYARAKEERQKNGPAMLPRAPSSIQQVQAVDPPQPPAPPAFPPAPGQVPPVPGQVTPTVPGPAPGTPPPPPFFGPAVTPPTQLPPVVAPTPRNFSIRSRSTANGSVKLTSGTAENGDTFYIISEPIIMTISNPKEATGVLDVEADRMIYWTKGDGKKSFENMRGPNGETTQHIEFYMAGNVEMRSATKKETETLRCDELYYDVSRNVAIATKSDLEIKQPKIPNPLHVKAEEMRQLNAKTIEVSKATLFSTVLPSDPGLTFYLKNVTIDEREVPKTTLFGNPIYDPITGQPKVDRLRYFKGNSLWVNLEQVPIFYFPYMSGNVEDPLGPLDSIAFGGSNIFGATIQSTWDLYQLLGIEKPANTRWRLFADYLTARGPGLGTDFTTLGKDLFEVPNKYNGYFKAYGINDHGINGTQTDILGGDRGKFYFPPPPGTQIPYTHPDWRGRIFSRGNVYDLPGGFTVQYGLGYISDQNYIEQYYINDWLSDLNQETYAYVKQQNDQWAWTLLAEPRIRSWITEAAWLPRADGWLIGQKLFDNWLTVDVHGSAGYAQLRTPNVPSFAYLPTDVNVDTGRFDLWSEASLPFTAGPFRVAPYIVGDAAYYTANVNGDGQSRFLGGAGVRASIPFSKLYPDITSEFFNLDGIYHKINFSTNYLYARSSTSYTNLPQLDRLNDDTTDQAMRDLQYRQIFINPANAAFLTNFNGLVNPQTYAIRRLIDSRIDTLDSINVVQFNLENRLQTHRGIGASEHVVDWMTLSLGASLFPQPTRDNYGEHWGILEYDWTWNIGDRTALVSNGWMEPVTGGPRIFNMGGIINRPDGTNFYLGYRQIDPLNSKAVVANISYSFSQKYSIVANTVWDFGVKTQAYGLGVTRVGTDVQMTLGLNYNSVLQTFGVQFEIIPNLLKSSIRGVTPGIGGGTLMSR